MKRLETPLKPVSQSTDGDVPEDACADDQQREQREYRHDDGDGDAKCSSGSITTRYCKLLIMHFVCL